MSGQSGNALKHGLTGAGVALPDDMEAEVARRTDEFTTRFAPADAFEAHLVRQLALASVRIDRCQAMEAAQRDHFRGREAVLGDLEREIEAAELFERLDLRPAVIVRRLARTTPGCRLVAAAWRRLGWLATHAPGAWSDRDTWRAVGLLGLAVPESTADPDAQWWAARAYMLTQEPLRDDAAREIADRCETEAARVEAHADRLAAVEAGEAALRAAGLWSQEPREIRRLQRYEAEARRAYARTLRLLDARPLARDHDPDTDTDTPPVADTPSSHPDALVSSTPLRTPATTRDHLAASPPRPARTPHPATRELRGPALVERLLTDHDPAEAAFCVGRAAG